MRIIILLLVLSPAFAECQSSIDREYALELVQRLQDDPLHDQYQTDMQLIFRWMDESADLMQLMNHPESNRIAARKRSYREQLQILYHAGIVRYLLDNPGQVPFDREKAGAEGRSCMCIGYAKLRELHRVRPDRYVRRICKNL